MEKELTIEHLSPYLPYNLEFEGYNNGKKYTDTMVTLSRLGNVEYIDGIFCRDYIFSVKPIIRPLSQLTQEIEHNGERFVPIEKLEEIRKGVSIYKPINDDLPLEITIQTEDYTQEVDLYDGYLIMQKLFEWHFDVFGLLDTGLAIEKGAEK